MKTDEHSQSNPPTPLRGVTWRVRPLSVSLPKPLPSRPSCVQKCWVRAERKFLNAPGGSSLRRCLSTLAPGRPKRSQRVLPGSFVGFRNIVSYQENQRKSTFSRKQLFVSMMGPNGLPMTTLGPKRVPKETPEPVFSIRIPPLAPLGRPRAPPGTPLGGQGASRWRF